MAINRYATILKWLLRFGGGVMLLATGAVVMPREWMAETHHALGLGTFPEEPITEYLARTASALYAIHGGLLVLASSDIRRFAPLIRYLGIAGCVFAVAVLIIDRASGMPAWWSWGESLQVAGMNAAILLLLWKARQLEFRRGAGTYGRDATDPMD